MTNEADKMTNILLTRPSCATSSATRSQSKFPPRHSHLPHPKTPREGYRDWLYPNSDSPDPWHWPIFSRYELIVSDQSYPQSDLRQCKDYPQFPEPQQSSLWQVGLNTRFNRSNTHLAFTMAHLYLLPQVQNRMCVKELLDYVTDFASQWFGLFSSRRSPWILQS